MKRVVAIGELLIDFVPEEKGCALREVTHFERVAGGAPANVAAAVSRLGGRGVMVSQVGDDAFGEHIIDVLKTNGVDTTYVFKTKKANTGLAFVSLDATGNREFSFFRNPSANLFLPPSRSHRTCSRTPRYCISVRWISWTGRCARRTRV